jgi:malate synthase
MHDERVERAGLQVATVTRRPAGAGDLPRAPASTPEHFWAALAAIVADLRPRNEALLASARRCRKDRRLAPRHPGADYDRAAYRAFLEEIGYLLPEPAPFTISTENVDPEVASSPARSWWCR